MGFYLLCLEHRLKVIRLLLWRIWLTNISIPENSRFRLRCLPGRRRDKPKANNICLRCSLPPPLFTYLTFFSWVTIQSKSPCNPSPYLRTSMHCTFAQEAASPLGLLGFFNQVSPFPQTCQHDSWPSQKYSLGLFLGRKWFYCYPVMERFSLRKRKGRMDWDEGWKSTREWQRETDRWTKRERPGEWLA